MGLSTVFLSVLSLACLIYLTSGSAIKTKGENVDVTVKGSSKTFGVKTVTRQTTHSNNGVVTRVFKQTQITTGNADAFPGNTENQAQFPNIENIQDRNENPSIQNLPDTFAIDHSSGQDDIAVGLLPLDDAKPIQFGVRLGSNTKQSGCSVKGGCSSQISVSDSKSSDETNIESHQDQLPKKTNHQNQEKTSKSNFETKKVENTQEHAVDQGQLQPGNVFGTDFDGQYEAALTNLEQGDEFADEIKIPVVDTLFPEQGDSQMDFDVGNVEPFMEESDFLDRQQENQQKAENPLGFGYVEQQSQGDSQDESGVYGDQQNVSFEEQSQTGEDQDQARNFEFTQSNFHQQNGNPASVVEQNNNFGFQQNTGFQKTFAPQSQVSNEFQQQFIPQSQVSNENNHNFEDNTQDFFHADPIEGLRYNVPGNPGEDYPILYKVPETSFQCNQQPFAAGIYGDVDAQCQVFHFCTESGGQNSFLCPNGTVFNQQYFVCDWWYNYNCSDTPSFYNLNAQLYWDFDTFEPSQIITGSGIGSSEEQQIDGGTFQSGDNFNQFSGSLPEQEQFQTRVTYSGHSQVDTTSTNQQVQSTVQQQDANSYVEKRQDVSNLQSNIRSSFTQQSSSAQNTNVDQQTIDISDHDFNSHQGNTETSDSYFNKKPTTSVSISETDSGNVFQPNTNVNRKEETKFDGSLAPQIQQNVNIRDFSVQEKKQNDIPSTSSDPRLEERPDSNSGTRYPDQNGYMQQHIDDQHQFPTNDQSVSNIASNSAETLSTHNKVDIKSDNQVSQEILPTESSNSFRGQNRNQSPQTEIQQQHFQIELDVSSRSDETSHSDSHDQSAISESKDLTTQSPQQGNKIESSQDVSFKRKAVFSSLNQDNVKQDQSSFGPETVSEQPNLLDVILPETFEEVDQDSQSARSGDDEVANQEKQIDEQVNVDAFDGQQIVDALQDVINDDGIMEGFGFINVATTPEPFDLNQRVYENRPAQVHALSVQRNSNQNLNVNTNLQNPSPNSQQENINVGNIFSIMTGLSNNVLQQNGNQRLSFRPYGQNIASVTTDNGQDQLSQKSLNNHVGNDERAHQSFNQGIREQVILPIEQKKENSQNEWWHKNQNDENIQSAEVSNQQGISTDVRNPNNNTPISQSHLNVDVSSNENINLPNNLHVQPHNSINVNQPQSNGIKQEAVNQNNQVNLQRNEQQRPHQNVKTLQEINFETRPSQFQSNINQPQIQNQNIRPEFHGLNNQQNVKSTQHFQPASDQTHLNGNIKPEFQNLNNQHSFQGVKGRNQHQSHGNQQVFGNNNNQQYFGAQRHFQNVNNQHQDVTNQNQFQEQRQFHYINNQRHFQNQLQFQNQNNRQPFQNFNNQKQIQEQHQFHNVNVQQQSAGNKFEVNNHPRLSDTNAGHAPFQNFEQNAGVKEFFPQGHPESLNSAEFNSKRPSGENINQNQGVKGYHSQQNFREARNGYNFPRPNLQTLNVNDAIIYSQNAPRSAESAISYNGWKPIVRY